MSQSSWQCKRIHNMAATGGEIRELGANEVAEGVVRGVAAAAMAERSFELAEASTEQAHLPGA